MSRAPPKRRVGSATSLPLPLSIIGIAPGVPAGTSTIGVLCLLTEEEVASGVYATYGGCCPRGWLAKGA